MSFSLKNTKKIEVMQGFNRVINNAPKIKGKFGAIVENKKLVDKHA